MYTTNMRHQITMKTEPNMYLISFHLFIQSHTHTHTHTHTRAGARAYAHHKKITYNKLTSISGTAKLTGRKTTVFWNVTYGQTLAVLWRHLLPPSSGIRCLQSDPDTDDQSQITYSIFCSPIYHKDSGCMSLWSTFIHQTQHSASHATFTVYISFYTLTVIQNIDP